MIKVGWDAGHGIHTAGKRTPDDEREWTFNDIVGRAFANELSLYAGVAIKRFDDPTGQTDVSLKKRTDGANAWGATHYVSFHKNAYKSIWGEHTGVETYISPNASAESRLLAQVLQAAQVKVYGLRDRGVKPAKLHIVQATKMPAALVEGPFMDSVIDIKLLRNKAKLEEAGREMARAFAAWKGLKKSASKQPQKESEQKVTALLNETGRKECMEMIQRGVEEKLFTSDHKNVDKYSDVELISYSMAYVNRKTKPKK